MYDRRLRGVLDLATGRNSLGAGDAVPLSPDRTPDGKSRTRCGDLPDPMGRRWLWLSNLAHGDSDSS